MSIPPIKNCLGLPVLTAFLVCFLMVTCLANALPPIQAVRWETNLNEAAARAEREQRPLFLHFVGNDNATTQQAGNEAFAQPNIAAHLNANFVMVRINAVENPALAQQFSVTAIPTDLIMKPNRQIIHRRVGVISAERFAEYLVFVQNMIQADKNQVSAVPSTVPPVASSSSVANSLGGVQPVPPPSSPFPGSVLPISASPVAAAQPLESANVAALGTFRDPFAQQPTIVQPPSVPQQSPVVGMAVPTTPANNPLRTAETPVKPALEQSAVSAPPVLAVVQSTQEEPAPTKMMIEVPLALEGFCPIVLCTEERWVSGNPAYSTMYQGHIFRFSSLEALITFARNPANYTPVAMGEDIVLKVDRNRRISGDRNFGAWFQGRVFLFSSQETFDTFKARPDYYAEIALKYEVARREQPVPIVY